MVRKNPAGGINRFQSKKRGPWGEIETGMKENYKNTLLEKTVFQSGNLVRGLRKVKEQVVVKRQEKKNGQYQKKKRQ